MENIEDGWESRCELREEILDKYIRWMGKGFGETDAWPIPKAIDILKLLADNVDKIPTHNIYLPNELFLILEPVAQVATLAGETQRSRVDVRNALSWPNIYTVWSSDNTAEKYWKNPANRSEADALKKSSVSKTAPDR